MNIGPYADTSTRAMRFGPGNRGWTIESCYIFCSDKGYEYFGMQNYFECYCDYDLNHTTQYGSSSCGATGDSWCNFVYGIINDADTTVAESISTDLYVGIGGYRDISTSRALRYEASGGHNYDADSCYTTCNNLDYTYFSLQDYREDLGWLSECYCDNNFTHATQYGNDSCGPLGGSGGNYIYEIIKQPTFSPTGKHRL